MQTQEVLNEGALPVFIGLLDPKYGLDMNEQVWLPAAAGLSCCGGLRSEALTRCRRCSAAGSYTLKP